MRPVFQLSYGGINSGLIRKPDKPAGNPDKAVPGQGCDYLGIECRGSARPVGDEAEGPRPPLAERALEAALPPRRLVPPATRRTPTSQGTSAATWDASEADGGAEIHQRVCSRRAERPASSLEYPADVRIDRQHRAGVREPGNGIGGVAADSGQLRQILGPAAVGDLASCPMKIQGPPVVSESLPGANHVGGRSGRERLHRRPALEPRKVTGNDPRDLRLLEHDLGDQDRVRIAGPPPRKIAPVLGEPGEQSGLHALRL
jgi:hypothetical protein